MVFSLTTLGTASALPIVNRYPSAHVLNIHGRLFLIDCGEGCQMLLRRYGFSFLKFDNLFISHLHGDHLFGIFGLLSTMAMMGRTSCFNIYAPYNFGSILTFFLTNFGEGIKYKINHITLSGKEPKTILTTRTVDVYSFGLNHKIDTYGFIFREKQPLRNVNKWLIERDNLSLHEIALLKKGENVVREDGQILENEKYTYLPYTPRSYAHICDTAPFESESEYIKGVSMLYHEATFSQELSQMAKTTFHSTAAQAAQCAKDANVGKLIVGHYSSRYNDLNIILEQAKEIFPNTYLSKTGMVFEIPLDKHQ